MFDNVLTTSVLSFRKSRKYGFHTLRHSNKLSPCAIGIIANALKVCVQASQFWEERTWFNAWSFPSIVKHFLHVCCYIVEIVWTGAILLLYSYLRCGYKSSSSIPVTQRLRMSKLPSDNCCPVLAMTTGMFIVYNLSFKYIILSINR